MGSSQVPRSSSVGAGRPRRRRRARKCAISVSLVEHAESHRAKYRSILPARQAGPSSAASARRVMEMSMRCSSVRLVQYLGGVVWPMPGDRSNCGCPRQIRTPLGPTRLHLGAYELHQVQPMASQCCMSSGRGHGFCIFELCVLPRGRLVGSRLQSRRRSQKISRLRRL